ncbi:MAG: hypothetical protein AB1403_21285 [Candidatus Riflebacteria bacterium]
MKKLHLMLAFCLLAVFSAGVHAIDTGKLLTNQCRANLKMLNEATEKFLKENESSLPAWSPYKSVKDMLLEIKYLPKDPEPPTKDCKYFLVSMSSHDYQWYCDVHGLIDGDKSITFDYHEHKFTAKTSSRYMNVKKYKDHVQNLLRWTEYKPTPTEKLKYQYNKNPTTTIALVVFGVIALFLIYRNVTQ